MVSRVVCELLVILLGLLGLNSCKTSKDGTKGLQRADKRMGDVRVLYGGPTMMFRSTPLILVDGEESSSLDSIDPNSVDSIIVRKGDAAIKDFGEKGKDGVIIVKTKK